jgi:hypothetical protein
MASIGNIYSQMDRGILLSVNTVRPTAVFRTDDGITYAVGGIPVATTWIPNFFPGMSFAGGCLYIYTKATVGTTTAARVNVGSVLSPVWSSVS